MMPQPRDALAAVSVFSAVAAGSYGAGLVGSVCVTSAIALGWLYTQERKRRIGDDELEAYRQMCLAAVEAERRMNGGDHSADSMLTMGNFSRIAQESANGH